MKCSGGITMTVLWCSTTSRLFLGTTTAARTRRSPTVAAAFLGRSRRFSSTTRHHSRLVAGADRSSALRRLESTTSSSTITSVEPDSNNNNNNKQYDYDFLVMGGGSGGVRASRIAAGSYGAKTCLLETQLQHGIAPDYSAIGGTCVNVGCVPKKLMVFASRYPAEIKEAAGYGWHGATAGTFDWQQFQQAKNTEISRLNTVYQKVVLEKAGVNIIQGTGRFHDAHTVIVTHPDTGDEQFLTAQHILIAVGGWPYKPNHIPGIEHAITSNEIFYLPKQPKRVVCVGGGFIALEFASILDGLGSDVTLLYRGELFLRGFDQDLREHLRDEMRTNTGIDVQFNTNPAEIIKNDHDGTLTVVTEDGRRIETDCVLMATGRKGRTERLNLEAAGVTHENSFIPVNEYSQTNVPHIYAVGDVTDRIALTPVALMEGHRLADTLFGNMDRPVDHQCVASTVFTNPELATCGLTEDEAVTQYRNVTIYKTKFRAMKHSFPQTETYTLFKLIVDTATDKVVGCHLASDHAGEMMQGVAIAMKMGATKADLDNTIGIHPTSAEELVTLRTPSYHYVDGVKIVE